MDKTALNLNSPAADLARTSNQSVRRLKLFALFAVLLCLAFAKPLVGLFRYTLSTELYSHVVMIPFISAYLVWLNRRDALPPPSSSWTSVIPFAIGLVALNGLLFLAPQNPSWRPNDYFALTSFTFLCFLWAGALLILGTVFLRAYAFPAVFLIFMMPMPTFVEHAVEVFFQHTSAEAAALLFQLTGSTVFRDGLAFQLPGIKIQVGQECSGIRSSLVLFITSLVAGRMLLHSPWKRAALTLFVIPLGILRNGFRIFTISMLCVHVSPAMIHSRLHTHGGPLFFLVSLIPFFLVLLLLYRLERRKRQEVRPNAESKIGE
jgi:exosortase C (VPDSG-CTERM-specific)